MLKISDYADEEVVELLRKFGLPNAAVAKRNGNIIHIHSAFRGPPDEKTMAEEEKYILHPGCDCDACNLVVREHGGSCILVHHSLGARAALLVLSAIDDGQPRFHIGIAKGVSADAICAEYETPPSLN